LSGLLLSPFRMERASSQILAVRLLIFTGVSALAFLLMATLFPIAFAEEENIDAVEISVETGPEEISSQQEAEIEGQTAEFAAEQEQVNNAQNESVQISTEMKMAFYIFIALVLFGSFAAKRKTSHSVSESTEE
jgi:hypothetical protein